MRQAHGQNTTDRGYPHRQTKGENATLSLAALVGEVMCKHILVCISVLLVVCGTSAAQTPPTTQAATQAEMAIDQIKKTVVFLTTSWLDSRALKTPDKENQPPRFKSTVGTGFLIFISVPELGKDASGNDRGFNYLVTAKHMIRQRTPDNQPGPYATKATVRVNTLKPIDALGRHWVSFDSDILDARGDLMWFVHDSDPVADVALTPVWLDESVEYKVFPQDLFATKSFVAEQHVNENDEVLFTGLFTGYVGEQKNYPVVRHGRLALLPGEDVSIDPTKPDKKSQIYLAEVTSFGGNSGSPVFLRIVPLREGSRGNLAVAYKYYLLGVMRGFISDEEAKQNTGIAVVVPTDKIVEILSSDRVKAYIATMVAQDKVTKGDLKAAESKFQESIAILERRAPESTQLIDTLRVYATMLQQAKRGDDARVTLAKAQKIAERPVSKTPEP